jgi:membrane protein implicated in regulation of membrane protease activity
MDIFQSIWNPIVIWFIVGLVLLLLEIGAPGLVLLFFGVGAWITAILVLIFSIGIDLQLFIFAASSVTLLILLRRRFQKLFKGKIEPSISEASDLIGERAVVVDSIIPPRKGRVEIHGTQWGAESEAEIPSGSTVEIVAQKNLTLKVKILI